MGGMTIHRRELIGGMAAHRRELISGMAINTYLAQLEAEDVGVLLDALGAHALGQRHVAVLHRPAHEHLRMATNRREVIGTLVEDGNT